MTDLSALGATTGGVWTRAQALTLLTSGEVDAFVRRGAWQVPWRGVYADAGHVLAAEQRGLAAVLAAGGADQPRSDFATGRRVIRAVACGRTAARAWGLPLVDCALLLSHEALVCALDHALHHHLVSRSELAGAVLARRGCAGGPALAEALRLGDARAEAPTQTLARLLLKPVLPRLEPQVELFDCAARLVARFDLGDRTVRLALEADGKRGHAGEAMVAKDRRRDRRASELGWTTERTTWFELRRQQQALVRRVMDTHRQLATAG